jgi:hypothetical protein
MIGLSSDEKKKRAIGALKALLKRLENKSTYVIEGSYTEERIPLDVSFDCVKVYKDSGQRKVTIDVFFSEG